jgi:hypothetical protein
MSLTHRIPALLAAFLSSAAVLLAAFAGTSCEFVNVQGNDDTFFLIAPDGPQGFAVLNEQQSSIGVLCNDGLYDREGDDMWELSRIFLILGLLFGSLTAALAWAVCSFMEPSLRKWKCISFLAAIAAVIQVPVFILLEAEPCSDFRHNQQCSLGSGAFVLIASDIFYIAVCICTQCLDPPEWAMELDFWKTEKRGASRQAQARRYVYRDKDDHLEDASYGSDDDQIHLRVGEHNEDEDIYHISRILPASKTYQAKREKTKSRSTLKGNSIPIKALFSCFSKDPVLDEIEVPPVETESTKEHEEDDDGEFDETSQDDPVGEYDFRCIDDSHLILRVLPDQIAPKVAPKEDHGERALEYAEEGFLANQSSIKSVKAPTQIGGGGANRLSSNAILEDLNIIDATASNAAEDSEDNNVVKPVCTSSDTILDGMRKLTKKLKLDSKRRKMRRKWRTGYSQMADEDDEYDSDDAAAIIDSPPLTVKLPVLDRSMDSTTKSDSAQDDGIQFQMPELSDNDDGDDDEQNVYLENENWMHLTAATSAGVRKAAEDFEDDDHHPFASNRSVGTCHSDPEPLIYDSGSEDASIDRHDNFKGDTSTLSDDSSAEEVIESISTSGGDSLSRGRTRESPETKRRRASSPVESIKSSCSLLHTTINEETEEDIQKELGTAYSLSRTVSAPEPRSSCLPGVLMHKSRLDLMKTLVNEVSSYDETRMTTIDRSESFSNVYSEPELEVGDIPMLSKTLVAPEDEDQAREVKDSLGQAYIPEAVSKDGENQLEDSFPPSFKQDEAATGSSPIPAHTWKEPELPTTKTWKKPTPDKKAKVQSIGDRSMSSKDLSVPARKILESFASSQANVSDETSDTDDTGCLSRTTDSYSDDSDEETNPRKIVVRSRSFDGSSFRPKRPALSKSLSPSRSRGARSFLSSKADPSASSGGRAMDIRIRRIQRLKGYVPLDDRNGSFSSPTRSASPSAIIATTPSEALTPKRKTVHISPDEKKEDDVFARDGAITNDFPEDLYQPQLFSSDSAQLTRMVSFEGESAAKFEGDFLLKELQARHETDESSPDFDSMLEQLDLQLIDLRRPVGAEYGDDEGSL